MSYRPLLGPFRPADAPAPKPRPAAKQPAGYAKTGRPAKRIPTT